MSITTLLLFAARQTNRRIEQTTDLETKQTTFHLEIKTSTAASKTNEGLC